MIKTNRSLLCALLMAALIPALDASVWAQQRRLPNLDPTARPPKQSHERVVHTFDNTDMLQGYVGFMKKDQPTTLSHYFVGEPIVIPLALVNHTKFPITLATSFNCRANLRVMIRPEGEQQFRYNGPYLPGYYGPRPIMLYPMDEFHTNIIVWADAEIPGQLAIAKPGRYTFNVSIDVAVDECPALGTRELKPEGGTFTITVDPTPKQFEPLIDLFKRDMNLVYLQLHKSPPRWGTTKAIEILQQYPGSPFTPFLLYSLAAQYAIEYERKPTKENGDKALWYYHNTIMNESPFWEEAFGSYLAFHDKLENAKAIVSLGRHMLSKFPEHKLGRVGNMEVLQKYMINTQELDPERYWAFLP